MSGRGRAAVLAGLVLAMAVGPAPVHAHERSYSYSQWIIDGSSARVSLRLAARDLARLPLSGPERETALSAYLFSRLQLSAGQDPCTGHGRVRRLVAARGFERFEWTVACGQARPLQLKSSLLVEIAPRHLHFASIDTGAGRLEAVLSASDEPFGFGGPDQSSEMSAGSAFASYVPVGLEHILSGYDHLAFLLALLLVGTAVMETAALVTGFTVGHSITLALAVLGMVRPDVAAVEAVIGLSIALVAAENIWLAGGRKQAESYAVSGAVAVLALGAMLGAGHLAWPVLAGLALFSVCYFGLLERSQRPGRLRWWVAAAFGLAHGFGFAGALVEGGLPEEHLGMALAGFNAGVELGQLGFVVLAWPLLGRLMLKGRRGRLVTEFGSAAVLALGVFWFVARNY